MSSSVFLFEHELPHFENGRLARFRLRQRADNLHGQWLAFPLGQTVFVSVPLLVRRRLQTAILRFHCTFRTKEARARVSPVFETRSSHSPCACVNVPVTVISIPRSLNSWPNLWKAALNAFRLGKELPRVFNRQVHVFAEQRFSIEATPSRRCKASRTTGHQPGRP